MKFPCDRKTSGQHKETLGVSQVSVGGAFSQVNWASR